MADDVVSVNLGGSPKVMTWLFALLNLYPYMKKEAIADEPIVFRRTDYGLDLVWNIKRFRDDLEELAYPWEGVASRTCLVSRRDSGFYVVRKITNYFPDCKPLLEAVLDWELLEAGL